MCSPSETGVVQRLARVDFAAVIDAAPVGVAVFDAETGDLLALNEETRKIVGGLDVSGGALDKLLRAMELRRPDGRLIPIDELPTNRAVRNRETVLADEVVIHLPGRPAVSTLVNASPISGPGGKLVSVVATIQVAQPAKCLNRHRTDDLDVITHELRTHLAAIRGSTGAALGRRDLPDAFELRQLFRIVEEQLERIWRLVDDLSDWSRAETGTLTVEPKPSDLLKIVERAVDASRTGAETHARVEIDLPPGLPRVSVDRRRIGQILGIVLSSLSVSSAADSAIGIAGADTGSHVSIRVQRDGAPAPGDGPLMSMCISVLEAHGGNFAADAGDSRRGARFTLTVPKVDEFCLVAPRARGRRVETPRVLVFDADHETRVHVRDILVDAGFAPVVTGAADEIERLVATERPEVVVTDLTPPWTDGFELMERVARISAAPVIASSGPGGEGHIGMAFERGAADHVAKPFMPAELVARINAALRNRVIGTRTDPGRFVLGALAIDRAERRVTVAGRPAQLTATEYRLLTELASAAGRVLSHEHLIESVWGQLSKNDPRVLRAHLRSLRKKLGDDAKRPRYIFTEIGVGYRMAGPSTAERGQQDMPWRTASSSTPP